MTDLISVNDKVLRIDGVPYQKGSLYVRYENNIFLLGSSLSNEVYSGTYDSFSNNGTAFASNSDFLNYVEANFFKSTTSGGGGGGSISSVNGQTGPDVTLTTADFGLGNVNNTSDANKPVSVAQLSALNLKQNILGFTPENIANKDTDVTLSSNSDVKYPSQKAIKTYADTKQSALVSGTNIKTVGGISLLGSGDLGSITDSYISSSTNWNSAYTNRITSLTTTGSSGAATLSSNVLNIPTYTLTGLGGISLTGLSATSPLAYNNTTGAFSIQVANGSQSGYLNSTDWNTFNNKQTALGFIPYNSTNPNNYITLTSLSSIATGLTYTNSTGVFSLTSGYVIPLTSDQTNWNSAYTNRITSLTTTGSSGSATLISNVLNIPIYTLAGLGGISLSSLSASTGISYNNSTGLFTLDTTKVPYFSGEITGTPSSTTYLRGDGVWSTVSSGITYTSSNGVVLTGNNFTLDNSYFSGAFTLVAGVATIGTGYVTNTMLSGSIDLTTKVTGLLPDANIASSSTWNAKQAALVSGTNIKTVAGISLLGSGDLGSISDTYLSNISWSKVLSTPTTITGYGITDAYTKTLSDARYLQSISGITAGGDLTGTFPNPTVAGQVVKLVVLNTPNVIFTNPVTFTTASNTATGTLALNTQSANTFLGGAPTGSAAAPTFRVLVPADIPTASSAEVLAVQNSYNVACWGDSLTAASNLTTTFVNSYPSVLSTLCKRTIYNGGIGGETSLQITARMLANTDKYSSSVIICSGRNDFSNATQVLADIASMVAALGHTRYIILSIINGTSEPNPSTGYTQITSLNATLASTYGANYLDIRSYMVSQYNPAIPQDVIDHGNDVPPSSLRTDGLHYTAAGYSLWANYVYNQKASILFPSTTKPVLLSDIGSINNSKTRGDFIQALTVTGGGTLPPVGNTVVTNGTFAGNLTSWTAGSGWSYSSNSALHTSGNTATLSQTLTLSNGANYFVSFVVSGSTTGTVSLTMPTLIGSLTTTTGSNTTYTYGFYSTSASTFTLTFTPTSTFDGAISNVIVSPTYGLINATPPVFSIKNQSSDDSTSFEIRASQSGLYNYSIGYQSQLSNMTGSYNYSLGHFTLKNNLVGYGNVALGYSVLSASVNANKCIGIGYASLSNLRNGTDLISIGYNSQLSATNASHNIAIGEGSLSANTTGNYNVAIGFATASNGTIITGNTAIGYSSLNLINGSYNTASGYSSGLNLTSASYNIMLGAFINAPNATSSGQLNIGNVLYGTNLYQSASSSSTPTTTGSIGIGLTTPTARLHLAAGTSTATTAPLKFTSGVSLTTPEAGAIEFTTDDYFATITTGNARKRLLMADNVAGLTSGKIPVATTNGRLQDAVNTDLPIMSSTASGAVPTPPNVSTQYLDGTGNWSTPAGAGGGTGTVTTVSIVSANGVSGTVATATTTPAITLVLGAITPTTIVASSTIQAIGLGIGIAPSAVLHISQNYTGASWSSSGVGLRFSAATYTDNTSSGTIGSNYVNVLGIPTLAASSATTYTNAATLNIAGAPVAGTNVTNTNTYALYVSGGNSAFLGDLQFLGATRRIGTGDANQFNITTNGSTRIAITSAGLQTHSQTAASSGSTSFLTYNQASNTGGSAGFVTYTAGTHTSQTTATEVIDIKFDLSPVMKMIDGTVALQRSFIVNGRTYTPQTTALTLTDASVLDIGINTAGTGTTITRNWSARFNGNITTSGKMYIGSLTTAPTASIHLTANTASAGTAPIKLNSGTVMTTPEAGAIEFDGTNFFATPSSTRLRLTNQVIGGNYTATGTATTTYTVTIPTQANNTYKVNVEPRNALTAVLQYVTNATTTTFDVVFVTALTGSVVFDWTIVP